MIGTCHKEGEMDTLPDEAPRQPLPNTDVDRELGSMPGWERAEGGIRKRYRRASFMDAVAFVNQIAELAEAAQHHPDINIRWRNVTIALTTHEAGGITRLDLDLAQAIEGIAARG